MIEWWNSLGGAAQSFFVAAFFFSGLFLWQFIAAMMGLSADHDVDVGGDVDIDAHMDADVGMDHPEFEHGADVDGVATIAAFKLLSIRSILAFLMLFSWAAALYLKDLTPMPTSLAIATGWGSAAMLLTALLLLGMRRLAQTGTPKIGTCLGTTGTVFLDIPANGAGEARVTVSGVVTHVKARGSGGAEFKAGAPVRVKSIIGPATVEVEPA